MPCNAVGLGLGWDTGKSQLLHSLDSRGKAAKKTVGGGWETPKMPPSNLDSPCVT